LLPAALPIATVAAMPQPSMAALSARAASSLCSLKKSGDQAICCCCWKGVVTGRGGCVRGARECVVTLCVAAAHARTRPRPLPQGDLPHLSFSLSCSRDNPTNEYELTLNASCTAYSVTAAPRLALAARLTAHEAAPIDAYSRPQTGANTLFGGFHLGFLRVLYLFWLLLLLVVRGRGGG